MASPCEIGPGGAPPRRSVSSTAADQQTSRQYSPRRDGEQFFPRGAAASVAFVIITAAQGSAKFSRGRSESYSRGEMASLPPLSPRGEGRKQCHTATGAGRRVKTATSGRTL